MSNTVELRVLDDEELMDVVGGCPSQCQQKYNPCQHQGDDCRIDLDIHVDLVLCV